jgi:CyaY protein
VRPLKHGTVRLRQPPHLLDGLAREFAESCPVRETRVDGLDAEFLSRGSATCSELEFADGSKCILNRQSAAHQIWLAAGASACHFAEDADGEWMDTKGRGPLLDVLREVLSARLGRPVAL